MAILLNSLWIKLFFTFIKTGTSTKFWPLEHMCNKTKIFLKYFLYFMLICISIFQVIGWPNLLSQYGTCGVWKRAQRLVLYPKIFFETGKEALYALPLGSTNTMEAPKTPPRVSREPLLTPSCQPSGLWIPKLALNQINMQLRHTKSHGDEFCSKNCCDSI